jgi:dTDP-4-dehydrorhamnose reductase
LRNNNRIYIAGSGGMLGEAFYHVFKDEFVIKCSDIDLNEDWLSYCDFRDYKSYREDVIKFNPNYLFHLGAFTDLEYCEENKDQTYITNTLSVHNAVNIANELSIPILYISTAGIFDGKKPIYDDWDIPNPLGTYARSKYMAELYVKENIHKHLICRAGWMMGGGAKKDKKFINKLFKKIKNGDKELFIVDDKDGTPTYTHDFAKNVKLLIENECWGLYNMVCGGQTSRYDVARELIDILNLSNHITLTKVSSSYFEAEYFAPRPPSERLINYKLDLLELNIMRDWKVALKEYIIDYNLNFIKID